jgi:hypothetical protein
MRFVEEMTLLPCGKQDWFDSHNVSGSARLDYIYT